MAIFVADGFEEYITPDELQAGVRSKCDCRLCERCVRVIFVEGVLAHDLGDGSFAYCMRDTNRSTRSIN